LDDHLAHTEALVIDKLFVQCRAQKSLTVTVRAFRSTNVWSASGAGALLCAVLIAVAGCASRRDDSGDAGIRVVHRTPDEFCRGTARSVAVDRYGMKKDGTPLKEALEQNGGVAVIDEITKAIYSRDLNSEAQAADAGTAACLRYFR